MKTPSYRKKPGRDFAIVEFRGKRIRLPGAYDSAESREAYRQFISTKVFGTQAQQAQAPLSVALLVDRYLDYAKEYYQPGTRGWEYANLAGTLTWVVREYGQLQATNFGPLVLKDVQQKLIQKKHSRTYINQEVGRIRRAFRWGVSEQLVGADVLRALETVQPLRAGFSVAQETKRREGVEWEVVAQTLAYCSPQIADMILCQWYTGVRSDSLCQMTWDQIDTSVEPWLWTPKHKSEYRRIVITVPLGPRCHRILGRHLGGSEEGFVFRPRSARNHPAYRQYYNSNSYRQHIVRALDRADAAGHKIPHWFPHQIRHSRERVVEREFGIEAARVALAHASLEATKIYSARDLALATEVALALG